MAESGEGVAAAVPQNGNNNGLKELADKYRIEFEQTFDVLRRRSAGLSEGVQSQLNKLNENIQNLQPQLKQQSDEVLQGLQNVEPVPDVLNKKISSVFAWTAVMQFGYLVGSVVGAYLLFPLLGLFVGTFWSALLVYLALPALALQQLFKVEKDSDHDARFKLLGLSLAQGLLTGYLFSSRYLSTMQPLAFLTPLLVAVSAQKVVPMLGPIPQRTYLLGAYLGTGVAAHLIIGLLLGQLSFAYLLLALLYTAAAYCAIQLYFKNRASTSEESEEPDHLYMLGYLLASIYLQTVVFVLFGGAKSKTSLESSLPSLPSVSGKH